MLNKFMKTLKASPKRDDVFNPWYHTDKDNDISKSSYLIRQRQCKAYLEERIGKAEYLLVAEALGYQGGHFTGIAMTSERILAGGQVAKGILPEHVFTSVDFERTSREGVKKGGFSEPTATIVWGKIIELGLDPYKFINWNAYPWHPFKPEKGLLSNRTPSDNEFQMGKNILLELIRLTGASKIIAVGEKSYKVLEELGISSDKVRHPANGGAGKFRTQLEKLVVC